MRVLLIVAFVLCAAASQALECYQCSYSELDSAVNFDNDEDCLEDVENFSRTCDSWYNACLFTKKVDRNGDATYTRSCALLQDNSGLDSRCKTWEKNGVEHTKCVCTEDNCNGQESNGAGGIGAMKFVLMAGIALKFLL